jgi:hypothetical protein
MHFQMLARLRMSRPSPAVLEFARLPACANCTAGGAWRKRKGIGRIRLAGGSVHLAEIHWYEATGIGKREFKIK